MQIVQQDQLSSNELEGQEHGAGVSIILVDAAPGRGPALHKHAYEEVFIVQEGRATFTAGGEQREVRGGAIVVVPPETPHRFVNSGDGPLRQIAIHVSPRFVTEWLDESA
jgi:mannose-6-phosphate isomerase-like protein (cupin superfamily)